MNIIRDCYDHREPTHVYKTNSIIVISGDISTGKIILRLRNTLYIYIYTHTHINIQGNIIAYTRVPENNSLSSSSHSVENGEGRKVCGSQTAWNGRGRRKSSGELCPTVVRYR